MILMVFYPKNGFQDEKKFDFTSNSCDNNPTSDFYYWYNAQYNKKQDMDLSSRSTLGILIWTFNKL